MSTTPKDVRTSLQTTLKGIAGAFDGFAEENARLREEVVKLTQANARKDTEIERLKVIVQMNSIAPVSADQPIKLKQPSGVIAVKAIVEEVFGLEPGTLSNKIDRPREITIPRHTAIELCSRYRFVPSDQSLVKMFLLKDHGSANHARKAVESLLLSDKQYRGKYEECVQRTLKILGEPEIKRRDYDPKVSAVGR